MERFIMKDLLKWKNSKCRKPLILQGVRRVGKTWLLKEFGRGYYNNVAYFNFEENEQYKHYFEYTKEVNRIIQSLIMASDQQIYPEKTLIIFDEVQNCPEVIKMMKYFCDNASEYHVICSCSMLGVSRVHSTVFPVDYVEMLQLNPMTFIEFLMANGEAQLVQQLDSIDSIAPISTNLYKQLLDNLKMFYVSGGMPEPVLRWTRDHDVEAMQKALCTIIGSYEHEFARHPKIKEFLKISLIWKSIPKQLANENKKFKYNIVKEGARAREYDEALEWLIDANLANKIYRSSAPALPFSLNDDLLAYKIYLVDVGVLRRHSKISPMAFNEGNRLFTENCGALSENHIMQSLINQFTITPRYWSQFNPSYEVDFLIQRGNNIFPVEVKAELNVKSRNLKKYKEYFPNETKLCIRFSLDNLKLEGDMLNIPLFMVDYADKIIGLALNQKAI